MITHRPAGTCPSRYSDPFIIPSFVKISIYILQCLEVDPGYLDILSDHHIIATPLTSHYSRAPNHDRSLSKITSHDERGFPLSTVAKVSTLHHSSTMSHSPGRSMERKVLDILAIKKQKQKPTIRGSKPPSPLRPAYQ
jgi:hypothetical protein